MTAPAADMTPAQVFSGVSGVTVTTGEVMISSARIGFDPGGWMLFTAAARSRPARRPAPE